MNTDRPFGLFIIYNIFLHYIDSGAEDVILQLMLLILHKLNLS